HPATPFLELRHLRPSPVPSRHRWHPWMALPPLLLGWGHRPPNRSRGGVEPRPGQATPQQQGRQRHPGVPAVAGGHWRGAKVPHL
ncbi:MAG: hypothetical protein ACKOGI_10600, partial [Vulcanococcus sp.]